METRTKKDTAERLYDEASKGFRKAKNHQEKVEGLEERIEKMEVQLGEKKESVQKILTKAKKKLIQSFESSSVFETCNQLLEFLKEFKVEQKIGNYHSDPAIIFDVFLRTGKEKKEKLRVAVIRCSVVDYVENWGTNAKPEWGDRRCYWVLQFVHINGYGELDQYLEARWIKLKKFLGPNQLCWSPKEDFEEE